VRRIIIFKITTFIILVCLLSPNISAASTDTRALVIKARIGKVVRLIVDTNTITFPNIDHGERKQIIALQGDIKVTVKARTWSSSPVSLNIIADGDLASGHNIIPVENVTWQAYGHGFLSGNLSKSQVKTAGSWTGSGIREGIFRYYLNNSWNYPKGEYQVTISYTLTAP